MREYEQFYIDGKWVEPSESRTLDVINPATEDVVGLISLGNEHDTNKAVESAKIAFSRYGCSSRDERIAILEAVIAAYQSNMGELSAAITEEMGAPIQFALEAQAGAGLGHLAQALEVLKTFEFEEQSGTTRIIKEPIGVCGMITPWNWPANQMVAKMAPALAVGCTMVLKPSEVAPFSAHILAKIIDEAGVPAGVFNMVNGDGPGVGTVLSRHPDVDMISITGSTRAGVLVAENAAETVKRVSQELGGKSANIILEDANLEEAVAGGVMGMFVNSGQNCNAPSRMLVPRTSLAKAEEVAAQVANSVVVGDPKAESTTMGPVVSGAQFGKIQRLIESGISEGAKLVAGGLGRPEGFDHGYYVRPTVFSEANNNMTIAREEIFGPVLTIIPYDSEEEAIAIANDTEYGLSGYVSSVNIEHAREVALQVRAGNVHINGAPPSFDMPFGGYKKSGNGREWGAHGFTDYLEIKAIAGYEN